ncbi:hypothetical protein [Mesorhizobium amorphae]|uniref:Uncharacterized protein n=1 Tax=Mesorhizobium amorphae CCNWGS0123 TaxID=1082933 RepID=G6YBP9_9HYPH|nr:hypothetical protein [Mesorhizobium amorphae]ANT49756.1 hypothetical protein A6B35_07290 [Mesorhizobium amorphae CCNWGS0123]EHH10890.1 hypothetical protein MEA186_16877 [Mesorhizobium amorphae CCNWGS0123]GLR40116.1 hypothetical protein GCM10007880_06320 [Mesorhizobium amorphae]
MAENITGAHKTRKPGFGSRPLVKFLTLAAVLSVLTWVGFKVSAYRDFMRDLNTYQGVKLGDSMDETKYALGYPPFVVGPPESGTPDKPAPDFQFSPIYQTDGNDPKNAMPDGKKVGDFLGWQYEETDHRIDLSFDPETKRISEIGCYANSSVNGNTKQLCPALFGIDSNSSEDEVLAKLGSPDAQKIEGASKSLRYDEIGLEVTLSKRRVYMLSKTYPVGSSIGWFLANRLL